MKSADLKKRGPLLAAMRAVVIKAIQEHGCERAAEFLGIGSRTLRIWMRDWGFPPRCKPLVDPDDLQVLSVFLGLHAEQITEVVHADCSLVHGLPAGLGQRIERATELLLTGNSSEALRQLLAIKTDYPEL